MSLKITVSLKTSVTLSEVCGKSEGKTLQDKKKRPAGILLNVTTVIYFKIKLQIK